MTLHKEFSEDLAKLVRDFIDTDYHEANIRAMKEMIGLSGHMAGVMANDSEDLETFIMRLEMHIQECAMMSFKEKNSEK